MALLVKECIPYMVNSVSFEKKNILDFTICGLSFLSILATVNIQEDSEPGDSKISKTPAQSLCLCCYKAQDTEAHDAVKGYVLYSQQK